MYRSNNGRMLFITSFDCYCSVITFSEGELGTPLPEDQLPPNLLPSQSEKKQADSPKLTPKKDVGKDGLVEKKVSEVELKGTPPSKVETVTTDQQQSSGKTPRRIRPIQLASFPSPGGENVKTPSSPTTVDTKVPPTAKTPPTTSSNAPPTAEAPPPTTSSNAPPTTEAPPPTTSTAPSTTKTVAKTIGNSSSKSEGPRRVNFITLAKFSTDKEQGQSSSNTSSSQSSLDEDSKAAGEPMETTE